MREGNSYRRKGGRAYETPGSKEGGCVSILLTERAKSYVSRMATAISGSGGRQATFSVALALMKGFSLPLPVALSIFQEWNAGNSPPWNESQLLAELKGALKASKPDGYLLRGKDQRKPVDEKEEKRRARQSWPAMRPVNLAEMKIIASLRNVSSEAVGLIASHGFLWRAKHKGHDCFVTRDRSSGIFAQARRLDGELFRLDDGRTMKSLNLWGSEGMFLSPGGRGGSDVPVLMIEGVPGLLEAAEFLIRADSQADAAKSVALVAATAAGSRFTASQLEKLRGRKVLILADPDETGQEAAAAWSGQLSTVGCTVRVTLPPEGAKDFGDLLKTIPASDPIWSAITSFDF